MRNKEQPKPAIAIRSLGCRTNQEEMFILAGELCEKGFQIVDNISEASIVIVNTCSVTSTSEAKTRRLINSLLKSAPQAELLVTGCTAEQNPEAFKKIKRVKWVVGNVKKSEICSIIEKESGGIYCVPIKESCKELALPSIIPAIHNSSVNRTRFPVKIQEGCDFSCAYCIVPQLRGPSRSAPLDKILDVVKNALEKGFKEIVITGTHIGQYKDSKGNRLIDLVERLVDINGDFRIRLSSLDPRDFTDNILNYIINHDKICKHIHLSLQSCSEEVLKKMNRPSDLTMRTIEKIIELRKKFFNISIGADIIVGFPGENQKEFEQTCNTIEKIKLSYAHIFRFSRRPGTSAMNLEDQIKEHIKNERSEILRKIVEKSKNEFIQKLKNSRERIIVESTEPLRGVTSNYLRIEIPNYSYGYNKWLDVIITDKLTGRYLIGKPLLN
ncbi:MAG: tRNA (N(6)-L-threonylcarbamoyladenosine(37)-C(2))-methylthiotransferase MtaB [Chitinispirillaceae bacterium]|nr:tRNA (N(6)-L-threonylcarbamoyladenosine(37)-C(2))-methylthiotransferase MtaB [Chitinispirillaceae bacterium]